MADRRGPVALVGSGEFLPVMEDVDRVLLDGRPRRAVFLPTAAAQEGPERLRYWIDLGSRHFERLGVEPVPVPVTNRDEADDDSFADLIGAAGLIYLSGGNPGYLADTLRGSAVWNAIRSAWEEGAALAGCSAGASALTAIATDVRKPSFPVVAGLRAVPGLAVISHFDVIEQWRPGIVARASAAIDSDTALVGIDEQTAIVGGPDRWTVHGSRRAWVIDGNGGRTPYGAGESFVLRGT
jgi:cyanophycinase